jgi:transcriptional regulator with XRE-family HTH domain
MALDSTETTMTRPRETSALTARPPFAVLLKAWRESRRQSQLEMALSAGLSQRHLSFLELGRARPSREMVLQLGEALDMPLRDRNALLAAAGFAPHYRQSALDGPEMVAVREALELLLKHHEPYPAVVVDRAWHLVTGNRAVQRVFGLFGDVEALWQRVCPDGRRNLLKMTLHPEGARPYIANWRDAAPVVIARSRREAEITGSRELKELLDEVLHYPGVPAEWRIPQWNAPTPPVLPLSFERDGMRLNLFSMISTFGTPQDVTTDELRVESFFPADEASAALLRRLADA